MKTHDLRSACVAVAALMAGAVGPARADEPTMDLARQLANPLASLTSVPFQYNRDGGIGPNDVERSTLNLQPVVPFALGDRSRWKVISRTVVPLVDQAALGPGVGEVSGVGDVTQSLFLTPVAPTAGGWLLGAGPVVQLPTGSRPLLTTDRWSAGPTAVALRQAGPWTYGALANHLWSVAGDGPGVSATFVQPFVSYVTRTRTTFALNTEATYDWQAEAWSVPIHLTVQQLLKVGPQPVGVFAAIRRWTAGADLGPQGWGLRTGLTLRFAASPSATRGAPSAPARGDRTPRLRARAACAG